MTTPAQPDTGAGAEPDTGSAPEGTTIDQQPDTSATDGTDWQAEAEKWKGLARKHEGNSKTNKQKLDELLSKQQGTPSLEDLQAELAAEREAREAAEGHGAELAYKNTVSSIATNSGLNAAELLDSGRFRDKVAELLGDDFDDDELLAAVEKVAKTKEFAGNPRFAGSKAPPRSGADITGGPGAPRQVTEDELHKMTPEQIVEAQEKGLLRSLLGG
jgi:hypothetical protein